MGVRDDWSYSNRFVPQIKQIVGPRLLDIAPLSLDMREATDLVVLMARDMRIAARIRRPGYTKYRYEFTIRSRRDSGAETELSKIVNGWGDWLFYGHADNVERDLCLWWLVDLSAFRAALIRNSMNGKPLRFDDKGNGDGTYFRWFDLRSFPKQPPILIASSHSLDAVREPDQNAPDLLLPLFTVAAKNSGIGRGPKA